MPTSISTSSKVAGAEAAGMRAGEDQGVQIVNPALGSTGNTSNEDSRVPITPAWEDKQQQPQQQLQHTHDISQQFRRQCFRGAWQCSAI
jgi:hypothetical protein